MEKVLNQPTEPVHCRTESIERAEENQRPVQNVFAQLTVDAPGCFGPLSGRPTRPVIRRVSSLPTRDRAAEPDDRAPPAGPGKSFQGVLTWW
ncbi:hypothetical protein GCM10011609_84900 [Lentzea pudingi]|uniref:Uncharacterized protein n=1 Tax=Lentzea pudingi TaxID=1789439 RepID=A0ABQ2IVQ3_9PSEU|nr:hypothetical protein GCM10011609_84900 [Lentzea pudingi]